MQRLGGHLDMDSGPDLTTLAAWLPVAEPAPQHGGEDTAQAAARGPVSGKSALSPH
ncbi:Uncharacterised protein [Delftia tsuruhatensis]|uniref:hypothetical protein n=1 Tax=Delftia tsuruhatensis TaxID=180282 RepID=UPI001E783A42|nr:hypothetical protein [Delftia tsuruhatensis]CAB5700451.1 Uncharacterised protein [Delftia tsuruhatensis]CAC9693511.1 Uncharacterised protein [Delftia tsuruhatensis]